MLHAFAELTRGATLTPEGSLSQNPAPLARLVARLYLLTHAVVIEKRRSAGQGEQLGQESRSRRACVTAARAAQVSGMPSLRT